MLVMTPTFLLIQHLYTRYHKLSNRRELAMHGELVNSTTEGDITSQYEWPTSLGVRPARQQHPLRKFTLWAFFCGCLGLERPFSDTPTARPLRDLCFSNDLSLFTHIDVILIYASLDIISLHPQTRFSFLILTVRVVAITLARVDFITTR